MHTRKFAKRTVGCGICQEHIIIYYMCKTYTVITMEKYRYQVQYYGSFINIKNSSVEQKKCVFKW